MLILSYMGTPQYGIETPAATRIIQDLAPEEGSGPVHEVPYEQLMPGVYVVNVTEPENMCPELDYGCPALEEVFALFTEMVNDAIEEGSLPEAQAVMVIEDWQEDLKKVTPRIQWIDSNTGDKQSYERHIYLHRDRISD